MFAGDVKVNLVPQGTFSERIRAAGMGIRAFFTPAGVGTPIAEDKEIREFDIPCMLELPLHADFAIIKAERGDTMGKSVVQGNSKKFFAIDGNGRKDIHRRSRGVGRTG